MTSKVKSFLYNEQATTKRLKVASVTMSCERDPTANRTKMVSMVDTIMQTNPDIELVLFGEMILGWYAPGNMISEPISQKTLETLVYLTIKHTIYLCFGMSEIDGDCLYNAQVLLNPQGEIQAVHRKRHLKPFEKQAHYQPGTVPVTITDIKGVKTGIVVCSDAASPRTMMELIRSCLDLILLSLADDSDEEWFTAKFNARMYDAWVVTANRYGKENGSFWNGHMVISDPCGELRAVGQDREQYLIYDLGFAGKQTWLKRAMRNTWVKTPLPIHVLRNWRRVKAYL